MMQHRHKMAPRRFQRGVTLVVGMIMLVLITLVVLASFHLGRNNLEIVGNAQQHATKLLLPPSKRSKPRSTRLC
jgi:Tfp pilus assembly protein PilX